MLASTGLIAEQEFADSQAGNIHRRVYVHDRSYFTQVQYVEEYYDVKHADGTLQKLSWPLPHPLLLPWRGDSRTSNPPAWSSAASTATSPGPPSDKARTPATSCS